MKLWIIGVIFCLSLSAKELKFSKSVNKNYRMTITSDLGYLKKLSDFSNPDPKTLKIFKLDKLKASTLEGWLFDRVQYVFSPWELGELDLGRKLVVLNANYKYENQDIFPDELLGNNYLDSTSGSVVMSNIGTALYLSGKQEGILLGLKFKNSEGEDVSLPISTPRTGIIKIGKNFYMGARRNQRSKTEQKILRLSTLFHEARHSDGNGHGLGFFHSICPKGHDYEGERACDSSTNGPYSVEAYLIKEMAANCKDCNREAIEVLKLKILDSLSRVIIDEGDFLNNFQIDTPEGKRQ